MVSNISVFNPLSANPAKWSNTLKQYNSSATADELFECVWTFCGVCAERVGSYSVEKLTPNM